MGIEPIAGSTQLLINLNITGDIQWHLHQTFLH